MRHPLTAPDPRSLHSHPLFFGVDPAVIARCSQAGTYRVVAPGAPLSSAGDPGRLVLLLAGSAREASTTAEGEELMHALHRAPDVIGEVESVLGGPARTECRAIERCVVLQIDRAAVSAALGACPRFAANVARRLAARLQAAEEKQLALAFEAVGSRLAALLLEYAEVYGLPVPEGTKIRVPLCQDDLARSLGVARRSVTRALKGWLDQGCLAKRSGCYVIRDPRALRAELPGEALRAGA
jgi:CRP-like cAMP-binding protein